MLNDTKICSKCKEIKPLIDFYKLKNGRIVAQCKKCEYLRTKPSKQEIKQRQRNFKIKCLEYKGGKCEICEYSECPAALDFHHLDPSKKLFGLNLGRAPKFEKCKEELDKCILLCCRCHRELHVGLHPKYLVS